jgi:hypothetical protein
VAFYDGGVFEVIYAVGVAHAAPRVKFSGFIRTTPRRVPQPSEDTVHVALNDYGKLGYEETDRVKARPIGAAAGRRAGNSTPGRSFTSAIHFTALPFLTRPKDATETPMAATAANRCTLMGMVVRTASMLVGLCAATGLVLMRDRG